MLKSLIRAKVISAVVVLAVGALAGCDVGTATPRTSAEARTVSTSVDEPMIREALRFGDLVLPAEAQILGVRHDSGIDQRYVLAIGTPPQSVDHLLAASKFTAPFTTGMTINDQPLDGYNPVDNANTASGRDVISPRGDNSSPVNRKVLVDRNDPAKTIVHWWLFTT